MTDIKSALKRTYPYTDSCQPIDSAKTGDDFSTIAIAERSGEGMDILSIDDNDSPDFRCGNIKLRPGEHTLEFIYRTMSEQRTDKVTISFRTKAGHHYKISAGVDYFNKNMKPVIMDMDSFENVITR